MSQSSDVRAARDPEFRIELESGGVIGGVLYPRFAPQTVGNFIALANSGYYDGTAFHRAIRDYCIQCGRREPGLPYRIRGEFEFNGFARNALTHDIGVLSMSRGANYDSAGSQFFIVLSEDARELSCLDGAYAAFGRVTEGLEHALAISRHDTDLRDEPLERQGIARVRVEAFGRDYPFDTLCPDEAPAKPAPASHRGRRAGKPRAN